MRAYKERHKLGRFSNEAIAQMAELERKNKEAAENIKVGDRCEVQLTEDAQVKRRGVVRFIGKFELLVNDDRRQQKQKKNANLNLSARHHTLPAGHLGGCAVR